MSLKNVLSLFEIQNPDEYDIQEIKGGLCNDTYHATLHGQPTYILQKIKEGFPDQLSNDMNYVCAHLKTKNWAVPVLHTFKHNSFAEHENEKYRLYDFIDAADVMALSRREQYFELGQVLSRFHQDTRDLDTSSILGIPGFHQTGAIIEKLNDVAKDDPNKDQINSAWQAVSGKNLFFKERRLVHGDARYQNFLFNRNLSPFTLIDFDTLMNGTIFIDIGDLLRSISCDANQEICTFDKNKVDLTINGYISNDKASPDFASNCYASMVQMSVELAARFLTDAYEEKYFGWDATRFDTQKQHNLTRAHAQMQIARAAMEIL